MNDLQIIVRMLSVIHEENKAIMKVFVPTNDHKKVDESFDRLWNDIIHGANNVPNSPIHERK